MEIQRLDAHEGPRLKAIRLAALNDAPEAFGSTYAETATRPDASWRQQLEELATFVIRIEGVDAGMVRGGPDPDKAGQACLFSMWVSPNARGRGAGAALVGAVVDWARSTGFETLALDVADDNAPAIALYARMGFEPTGETGSLPPPRHHRLEHRRALKLSAKRDPGSRRP